MGEEIAKIDWDSDNLPAGMGDDFPDTLVLPLEDVVAKTQSQISVQTGPKKNTGALQEIPPEQFLEMEELAKWFSESTARSAILISRGEVIATSGEIDGERQKKFAREVSERFQASEARELIRYIPPQQGTGNELLFASGVDTDKFLVLTYDADSSYSVIREQAERLRKQLAESRRNPPVKPEEVTQAWWPEAGDVVGVESNPPGEIVEPGDAATPEELATPPLPEEETGMEIPAAITEQAMPETGVVMESLPGVMPSELNIEEDFPLSDPGLDSETPGEAEEYPWLAAGAVAMAGGVSEASREAITDGNPSTFPWDESAGKTETSTASSEVEPEVAGSLEGSPVDEPMVAESNPDEIQVDQEAAQNVTTAELELKGTPEGGTGDLRVFLLVPADPRVFLTGKLAAELGTWIPQVCQSMNWEVDALAVRPEFVRIGLIAAPDQKDDLIVVALQDATTRLVAANYPQMALDPEKPLFWADDFLKINPNDPPDQNELNAFIRHLRR